LAAFDAHRGHYTAAQRRRYQIGRRECLPVSLIVLWRIGQYLSARLQMLAACAQISFVYDRCSHDIDFYDTKLENIIDKNVKAISCSFEVFEIGFISLFHAIPPSFGHYKKKPRHVQNFLSRYQRYHR
jgi:hypothetical protein